MSNNEINELDTVNCTDSEEESAYQGIKQFKIYAQNSRMSLKQVS